MSFYRRAVEMVETSGMAIIVPSSARYGYIAIREELRQKGLNSIIHASISDGKIYIWTEWKFPLKRLSEEMKEVMDREAIRMSYWEDLAEEKKRMLCKGVQPSLEIKEWIKERLEAVKDDSFCKRGK
jgi:hypothetical protein